MFRVPEGNLLSLFTFLSKTKNVYLPIKNNNQVNYDLWNENSLVDLETLRTTMSPKNYFFPHVESLYTSKVKGKKISIESESIDFQPFVIFGVRGCDVKGFEVLDNVFLNEPTDTFYEARRNKGIIISLACNDPQLTCFCSALDIDATQSNADILTWLNNGYLYWEAKTKKGEYLTDEVSDILDTVEDKEPVEALKKNIKEKIESLPYSQLPLDRFKSENLNVLFNSPRWEELHMACIACGTCTFICPTCQCYDVKDFNSGNKVKKYRCWDSCMYSDFTLMAHGNPRKTQMERFRQRFMHKLIYYPANYNGLYSCVGCGRCVNKCPVSLNIVKVINDLGGVTDV